MEIFLTHTVE